MYSFGDNALKEIDMRFKMKNKAIAATQKTDFMTFGEKDGKIVNTRDKLKKF